MEALEADQVTLEEFEAWWDGMERGHLVADMDEDEVAAALENAGVGVRAKAWPTHIVPLPTPPHRQINCAGGRWRRGRRQRA